MKNSSKKNISIIGSGIIGLSTAYLALQKGFGVTVFYKEPYYKTVSMVAGASFKLNKIGNVDHIETMIQDTWDEYKKHMDIPGKPAVSGIRLATHMVASNKPIAEDTMHHLASVKNITRYPQNSGRYKIPGGYTYGISYTTFLINPHIFLPYLVTKITDLGGIFEKRYFKNEEAFKTLSEKIIFNCTGLGARELTQDTNMKPIKGQLVMIEYPEIKLKQSLNGLDSISADGRYIYPHPEEKNAKGEIEIALGGTADESFDLTPNPTVTASILNDNGKILSNLHPKKSLAGLRPYREGGPKIGKRIFGGKIVIDNYGHGGSGYTLCFGSAKRSLGYISNVF